MPHLTQPQSPDGCILTLFVGVSQQREIALKAANLPIPTPVQISALIDTGASSTVIDEGVLKQLGLNPNGTVDVLTPSTRGTPVTLMSYDVFLGLYLPTFSLLNANFLVVGSDFSGQNVQGLFGRDLLKDCVLIYNGSDDSFTLGF